MRHRRRLRSLLAGATCLTLLGACVLSPEPTATGATTTATPIVEPTPSPTPEVTPVPAVDVPLAVVTGYTNPVASITEDEVRAAIAADTIVQPCEQFTAINPTPRCLIAEAIIAHVTANPTDLALLPAGLVTPTVKVLPVDGADLLGGPSARALPYPITATFTDPPDDWLIDPAEVRTLMSLGDSCPDRGVAYAAITLGRGWDWVFGGGTAEYTAVYPNPVPPGFVGNGFNIVDAVPTGNEGAPARSRRDPLSRVCCGYATRT